MKKGGGKEDKKEKQTHTKELEKNNEKTILNIFEATLHYSPLIPFPAQVFIHLNCFTNYFTSFAAFIGSLSCTEWLLYEDRKVRSF